MRIAIIRDDLERGSGIGRYATELIAGLKNMDIYVRSIIATKLRMPYGDVFNHLIRLPLAVVKDCSRYDLLHAITPVNAIAFPFLRNLPKVVTYHDLTSLLCKGSGAKFHVRKSAFLFLNVAKYCDKAIAVSTQTKNEMTTYLKIPAHKIAVINLGVDEKFVPVKTQERNYSAVGYLGAMVKRKRIDYLILAFHHLRRRYPELKVKLVIWGKGAENPNLIKLAHRLHLVKDVEFNGSAPEEKLVEIYNSFDVFVLPSEWEGFGMPVLEAQRCGVPVIIRENAHLPEETARCCIKAKSEEDMANKLHELLTNTNLRDDMVERGLEYSKKFTWGKTIEETIEVYREALK